MKLFQAFKNISLCLYSAQETNGNWVQTYSGVQFFPFDPDIESIRIEDIAHSLSMQCRFNGHCSFFYSVAEHCIHVSNLLPPEHKLAGLLHDAAEAYLGDLPRPLKNELRVYQEAEAMISLLIAKKFGLTLTDNDFPIQVKFADLTMLATEKKTLMSKEPDSWGELPYPIENNFKLYPPENAKQAFLKVFYGLMRLKELNE